MSQLTPYAMQSPHSAKIHENSGPGAVRRLTELLQVRQIGQGPDSRHVAVACCQLEPAIDGAYMYSRGGACLGQCPSFWPVPCQPTPPSPPCRANGGAFY